MKHGEPLGWHAELDLGFVRRGESTVLARRRHTGPLAVQKPLYPEGEAVCHAIVLHPPAGIAGGDELRIGVEVEAGAQALLTTPGAGKWYRSGGRRASQDIEIKVSPRSTAEWLPQETIVFDGARATMRTDIQLGAGARYLGWEILCLGRSASGERFGRGSLQLSTRIAREGRLLWAEQGAIEGGSPWMDSPAGFAGCTVSATLLAAGAPADAALIAACREVATDDGARCGVTALPDLVVARWLGDSGEAARDWLEGVWRHLRPALIGREAQRPRIWNT